MHLGGIRPESRPLALAALATSQHGVVSSAQLLELGYSSTTIARHRANGRLHRVHKAAYAVGHGALTDHGRCLAAVLASAAGAVASHAAAAWLWGIDARLEPTIDVTVSSRGRRRRGIRIHHSTILCDADLTAYEGIPVTAVPRTLLDIAAERTARALERSLERTEHLGLLELAAIDELLRRCGGHAGRDRLRDGIALYRQPGFFRSGYERRLRMIIERAQVTMPSFNFFVEGQELDAYWESARFAVEVDAYSTHGSQAAFERDHARDERLRLAGIEIARFTTRQIESDPDFVGIQIRERLSRRRMDIGTKSKPDVALSSTSREAVRHPTGAQ